MDRFSALADQPLAWEITAAHFIVAANELVTLEAAATPDGFSWSDSGSNWPVLLLYATAAENLLKAIRIAQGEPVTSGGALSKYYISHNLTRYATDAHVGLSPAEGGMLQVLRDVLEAGKYPVPTVPGKNPNAWRFSYPDDVHTVWSLLQRLDDALRHTGTKCLDPFEVAKLQRPRT